MGFLSVLDVELGLGVGFEQSGEDGACGELEVGQLSCTLSDPQTGQTHLQCSLRLRG